MLFLLLLLLFFNGTGIKFSFLRQLTRDIQLDALHPSGSSQIRKDSLVCQAGSETFWNRPSEHHPPLLSCSTPPPGHPAKNEAQKGWFTGLASHFDQLSSVQEAPQSLIESPRAKLTWAWTSFLYLFVAPTYNVPPQPPWSLAAIHSFKRPVTNNERKTPISLAKY